MNIIYICICLSKNKKHLERLFKSIKNLTAVNNYKTNFIFILNGIKNFKIPLNKNNYIAIRKNKKNKIPQTRNLILEKLRNLKFNYAAFIDDDCFFNADWLLKHYNFLKKNSKFDIVSGPQKASPKNIFHYLIEANFRHGTNISWCPSNNVFFKNSIINETQVRFDCSFQDLGGSDQLFFNELSNLGYKIIWNNYNPVFEHQDRSRFKLSWFINRNIRYGSSGFFIEKKIHGKFAAVFISLIKIFYYFFISIIYLMLIPIDPKVNILNSLKNFSRVLGRIKIFITKKNKYV